MPARKGTQEVLRRIAAPGTIRFFRRRKTLETGGLIQFLAAVTAATALAACSNPTQGMHVTNTSSSILPAVQQSAAIPADSLFIGGTGRISVFSDAAGGFVPTTEITDHVTHEPRAMGIDRDGDLFVADYSDVSQISLYRLPQDGKYLGALTKGVVRPTALELDGQNNLAVVVHNERNRRTVRVFPSAASDRSFELKDVSGPGHLAYDSDGDLFVANADSSSVGIYHPGEICRAFAQRRRFSTGRVCVRPHGNGLRRERRRLQRYGIQRPRIQTRIGDPNRRPASGKSRDQRQASLHCCDFAS